MSNTVLYQFDITIHEGTTYDKWFKWIVDDVVQSLTGVTGLMQIRSKITDEEPIINLPFISTPWEADGTSGIYLDTISGDDAWKIYINNEDTANICVTHKDITGTYNLLLYNSSEECILKQYGVATLIASVVRAQEI